ncbi:hypothetical protein AALP_AA3G198400 [Arabis alpina]|uniref:PHD-type domain-containing protein n=1 Tax=Arabis alpina TaxID=50452 RepID=A0A087HAC8_ARAAL|nr:hypothetical protein AALP_AA3G198400 [Arabis alpina]
MNPDQNRRQCIACGESEPSFIHTVSKNGVFRRLCTDCLLKEHRELFCPVCLVAFVDVPPPNARIICLDCSSITHLACSPPPSSSSSFTCPPCSDPNFSFFPKSHLPSSDQIGENVETPLDTESGKALLAAAEIAVVSMNNAVAQLKNEAVKKILDAKMAKMRAKEALANLQDLVVRQKASENNDNPSKRKNSDR